MSFQDLSDWSVSKDRTGLSSGCTSLSLSLSVHDHHRNRYGSMPHAAEAATVPTPPAKFTTIVSPLRSSTEVVSSLLLWHLMNEWMNEWMNNWTSLFHCPSQMWYVWWRILQRRHAAWTRSRHGLWKISCNSLHHTSRTFSTGRCHKATFLRCSA